MNHIKEYANPISQDKIRAAYWGFSYLGAVTTKEIVIERQIKVGLHIPEKIETVIVPINTKITCIREKNGVIEIALKEDDMYGLYSRWYKISK